jgi:hypothetical protein
MTECEGTNLFSLLNPVFDSGAEVNASVNARIAVFGSCLGKARKRPRQASKRNTAGDRERHIVVTIEAAPPRTL